MAASEKKRQCFFIAIDCFDENGYIPSLVTEGEPGHSPMTGDPAQFQSPWYWGKTFEEAKAQAAKENEKLGLTQQDVHDILISSMFAPEGRSTS